MSNSHALSSKAIDVLLKLVPGGSTVLEIGTGLGTQRLSESYRVISVEHDARWHTGHSELLHVPLVSISQCGLPNSFHKRFPSASKWYDPNILKQKLAGKEYAAIIVDGPPGGASRAAMWWFYEELFNTAVPVIVDDVHRKYDWQVAINIGRRKGVMGFNVLYGDGDNNMFAVVV